MITHRRPSFVLSLLALAVALAGVASGAIPGNDGKIKGCYEDATPGAGGSPLRDLFVVDERDACPGGTTELTWSQTGPVGGVGPTGPAGPPGAPEGTHGVYRTDIRFVHDETNLDVRAGGWGNVICRRGETAIGGGGEIGVSSSNKNRYAIAATIPTSNERGWAVRVERVSDWEPYKGFFRGVGLSVWALCARTLVTAVPPLPPATGVTFGPRP